MESIPEKPEVGLDRNSFFLGLAIALAIVVIAYYFYNRFQKDGSVDFAARQPAQPEPQLLEKSPFVQDITKDSEAQDALRGTGVPKVLLVHAPWCGHCRNMMGAYLDAASKEPGVHWLRADGNSVPLLVNRPDLRGFPTIYGITANGDISQHNGARDSASLIKFAKSLSHLPSKETPVVVEELHPAVVEELDEEESESGTTSES